MNPDRTEEQSTEERERSQSLSRQRNRPPIEIPGYSIRQFLGAGAYGEVWVALDNDTGRKVAIKFYTHRGGLDWSLLSSEVEKLVFLSADRYVVQLLAVGWDSDPPYYVMEYIENGSLESHLAEHGPLAVGEAVELFREVATGLLHAHGKGVLHCDLKPANILLDQEHKPRLADFGQSRLSHEQTPALGTLFYMAPEQASLKAIPDARWDVYALGSMLYRMLTGEAPHRSDDAISEIDSVDDLEQRLQRYRDFIQNGPQPSTHREMKGVDRPLAEIVDRCLAVDPAQRFSNVQSVLDALRIRDSNRDRKPLLILGLLGPLLFLLIAAYSGWRGYDRAVQESNQLLFERSVKGNGFAADFVSEAVARRIEGYFRSVEELAADPNTMALVQAVPANPDISDTIAAIQQPGVDKPTIAKLQRQLFDNDLQKQLQGMLIERMNDGRQPEVASWFITDARGTHLAAVFDEPVDDSVGKNFSYRSYFTGASTESDEGSNRDAAMHVTATHLSAVFQSTANQEWKFAVSAPIWKDKEFLGVAALTVELGRLGELLRSDKSSQHFNVLVVDRDKSGIILQHPLFEQILGKNDDQKLPSEFSTSPEYRVRLDRLDETQFYEDPLSKHALGSDYRHRWVAAKRPVLLEPIRRNGSQRKSEAVDTGLVVIVQENYDEAAGPVYKLGDWLMRLGLIAFGFVLAVVLLLWVVVARTLRNPDEQIRRQGGPRPNPTSLHSMETVELPARLRRPQKES